MEKAVETRRGRFLIRPYRVEDEKGVLSLWQAAFGKEINLRLWRWKYLDNPYGHQIMLCISEAGAPVAMYSGIPYKANWQGKTVRITHLMDNASHPDYRSAIGGRTGLFVRTADAFFDEYGGPHASVFIYGFPGRRHSLLGKRVLKYVAFPDGLCFMRASTTDLARKVLPFHGKIERITIIDDSLNCLAEEYRPHFPFAVIRDAAFLGWRFMEHPEKDYEVWAYRSYLKKALKCYAVFFFEGKKACLVDILAPPSNRVVKDFLGRIGKVFAGRGIEHVESWLPGGHSLISAGMAAGFVPFQEPFGIMPCARIFHPSLSFDWAFENMFCSMADGDLF